VAEGGAAVIRRIYVIEVGRIPMECHFRRRNAEAAMDRYRLRAAMPPKIVPYAPMVASRRKAGRP